MISLSSRLLSPPSRSIRFTIRAMLRQSSIPEWCLPSRGKFKKFNICVILPAFWPYNSLKHTFTLHHRDNKFPVGYFTFEYFNCWGSICRKSQSPHVTIRHCGYWDANVSQFRNTDLNFRLPRGGVSICSWVMPVRDVQKVVMLGKRVGRTKERNSLVILYSAVVIGEGSWSSSWTVDSTISFALDWPTSDVVDDFTASSTLVITTVGISIISLLKFWNGAKSNLSFHKGSLFTSGMQLAL